MVGGSGTLVILLSSKLGYSGAGPLAAIMIPLIASICWKLQGWSKNYVSWKNISETGSQLHTSNLIVCLFQNPVIRIIHTMWITIQPLLFGLIGTEIKFDKIQLSLVWMGSLVVLAALLVHFLFNNEFTQVVKTIFSCWENQDTFCTRYYFIWVKRLLMERFIGF